MPITERERLGGGLLPAQVPAGWEPEKCPDLTPGQVPWHDWVVPWRTDITTARVVYAGDIGAHPNFSTFKALVASMYGLSVA